MDFGDCGTTSRIITIYNELILRFYATRKQKQVLNPATDASIIAFDQFKEVMWMNFEKEETYNFSTKDAIVDSYMFSLSESEYSQSIWLNTDYDILLAIDSTIKFFNFTEEGENDINTIHVNFIDLVMHFPLRISLFTF